MGYLVEVAVLMAALQTNVLVGVKLVVFLGASRVVAQENVQVTVLLCVLHGSLWDSKGDKMDLEDLKETLVSNGIKNGVFYDGIVLRCIPNCSDSCMNGCSPGGCPGRCSSGCPSGCSSSECASSCMNNCSGICEIFMA